LNGFPAVVGELDNHAKIWLMLNPKPGKGISLIDRQRGVQPADAVLIPQAAHGLIEIDAYILGILLRISAQHLVGRGNRFVCA
jgi:hypothetical protein